MVTGIIYRYISPIGKSYIGQTTRELYRRRMWFGNSFYTSKGSKIDNARRKYGAENFKYEILHKKEYNNIKEATIELNRLESYYIGLFDTFKNGYNCTLGGDGNRGVLVTEETRKKLSIATKGKKKPKGFGSKISKKLKGVLKSELHKKKLSESRHKTGKAIAQYTLHGELIKIWSNINDLMTCVKTLCPQSIYACCAKKTKSAHNFIWRYCDSDHIPPKKIRGKPRRSDSKSVIQLSLNNEYMREFPSAVDAAEFVGAAPSNITACCRGKINTIKGFKWIYKNGNL